MLYKLGCKYEYIHILLLYYNKYIHILFIPFLCYKIPKIFKNYFFLNFGQGIINEYIMYAVSSKKTYIVYTHNVYLVTSIS